VGFLAPVPSPQYRTAASQKQRDHLEAGNLCFMRFTAIVSYAVWKRSAESQPIADDFLKRGVFAVEGGYCTWWAKATQVDIRERVLIKVPSERHGFLIGWDDTAL
jgi:hypothetical protein